MRKPTLHSKMKMRPTPGISNYLIKQAEYEKIVQTYADLENRAIFNVIPAGTIPPNPVELLSSSRMAKALESFKNVGYDYIILDLPPIGEVTDAMVAAKHTDGMLIASRMNYGNKNILTDALKQFEFVNAKILGIVANCVNEEGKAYGYNKYGYGKYKYAYQRKSYYKNNRK
jgi:capsular exopolysaccharide synthesis family protein